MGIPIQDALNISPPVKLSERSVYVSPNKLSTFRLMHDPHKADTGGWFDSSVGPVRAGNEAMFLVRGSETYKDMAQQIRNAEFGSSSQSVTAFVYVLAWYCDVFNNFFMVPGDPTSSPKEVFKSAANKGVEVRTMFWSQRRFRFGPLGSEGQGNFINALRGARAIVDDKTGVLLLPPDNRRVEIPLPGGSGYIQRLGSHHQKVVVVNGPAGLIAYCGGIDINIDRVDPDCGGPQKGFQDVHVRFRGPVASDLLVLFCQRWDDYMNGDDPDVGHDPVTPKPSGNPLTDMARNQVNGTRLPMPQRVDSLPHRQHVQIARTFHHGLYTRISPPGQPGTAAAATGEKGIRRMIFQAMLNAQRFIYMEDQYLFDTGITAPLQIALAKSTFRHLIIMIPDDNGPDGELYGQTGLRRANVLNPLINGPNGHKVHVFVHERFVHSKIYIFDDKHAIIGSANCNRRGLSHDSEVDAGIYDQSSDVEAALHFPRRLRMRLWATHFNLKHNTSDPNIPVNDDEEYSELADGVASAVHWFKRPDKARIRPYTVNNTDALQKAQTGLAKAVADLVREDKLAVGGTGRMLADYIEHHASSLLSSVDLFWDYVLDPKDR